MNNEWLSAATRRVLAKVEDLPALIEEAVPANQPIRLPPRGTSRYFKSRIKGFVLVTNDPLGFELNSGVGMYYASNANQTRQAIEYFRDYGYLPRTPAEATARVVPFWKAVVRILNHPRHLSLGDDDADMWYSPRCVLEVRPSPRGPIAQLGTDTFDDPEAAARAVLKCLKEG